MKRTIKYLQDGKYHYATVKDVGDIELLKTKNKADLVSAINELITDGVKESNGEREAISKEIEESIKKSSEEIAKTVEELSKESALAFQEKIKVVVDLTNAEIKRSTDSLKKEVESVRKEGTDLVAQTKKDFEATVAESNEKVAGLNKKSEQLNSELALTKKGLQQTAEDLSNAKLNVIKVDKKIDEVKGELSSKVSSAQLDKLKEQLEKTNTEVRQTNKELAGKVSQESLDLLKGDLKKTNAQVKIQSELIEGKVSKDTLVNDLTDFQVKKANLLSGTREFMNWNKSNQAFVHNSKTTFNHCTSIEISKAGESVSLDIDGLTIGQTYTVSIDGIAKANNEEIHILAKGIGIMATAEKRTKVTTQHDLYYITFVAKAAKMTVEFVADGTITNGNILSITMPKLEVGANPTPWEQNFNDSYARIEHVEAAQRISADQIDQVVKKQTEIGNKQTQTETTVSHLSDGMKIQTEKLEKIGKDVTEQKGKIDLTAQKLRTEFEESTNKKIGSIQDTGNNLIENSAFVADFESWQTVSKKAKLEKIADDRWLNLSQSGLTAEMPIAAVTNYFPIQKNDHLVVAFDFIVRAMQMYDEKTVFQIEFFDIKNNRVDFKEVTLKDLNAESISSNAAKRLVWKTVVTREDVKKATIEPILKKNGDVLYTRFFAKVSSIDDGNYQPNPQDLLLAQAKQKFELEQTAQGLKGKASTQEINALDKKIKENELQLEANSKQVGIKLTEISNDASHTKESVQQNLKKIGSVEQKVNQASSDVATVKKEVSDLPAYIQSRGQNLVTNGYGTLKSNKNFPSLTFDPVHRMVGSGSFRADGQNSGWESEELIDIDTEKIYGYKYFAKTKTGKSRSYAYLVPYDVDNLRMDPTMFARTGSYSPTITPKTVTLTKELKQGDMEIHLSSVADFSDQEVNSDQGHENSILFWGYKNSLGYEYPVGTYSRLVGFRLWTKGQVDRKNNVIKLLAPFSVKNPSTADGKFPAGWHVSPTRSGGTFIYPDGAGNIQIPTDWQLYDLTIDSAKLLPMGVAKIKIGGLFNRDLKGETDVTWYNGIEFFDKTRTEDVKKEAEIKLNQIRTSVEQAKTESNKKFAEMTASTEKIRQSIGEVSLKTETTLGQFKTKFETDINSAKKAATDSLKTTEGSINKKIDDTRAAVEKDIQSVKGDVSKNKADTTAALGEISKTIQSQQTENQKKWAENVTTQDQIKQSVNDVKTTTTKTVEETKVVLTKTINDSVEAAKKVSADSLKASEGIINKKIDDTKTSVEKNIQAVKGDVAKNKTDTTAAIGEINKKIQTTETENQKKWAENVTTQNQIKQSVNDVKTTTTKTIEQTTTTLNKKISDTVNGAKTELNKTINDLDYGGDNLYVRSSIYGYGKNVAATYDKNTNTWTVTYKKGIDYDAFVIGLAHKCMGAYEYLQPYTDYVYSFDYWTDSPLPKISMDCNNHWHGGGDKGNDNDDVAHRKNHSQPVVKNKWTKFQANIKTKNDGKLLKDCSIFGFGGVGKTTADITLKIRDLMLQKGKNATNFIESSEEPNIKITSLDKKTDGEIKKANGEIAKVNGAVNNANGEITKIKGEITRVDKVITTEKAENAKKFADITTKNNQIVQQVGDLKTSTTKTITDTKAVIENDIAAAKNDLQGKITTVEGRVTTVQKDFDSKVAAVKTESGKINTKVSNLEGTITKTQKELAGMYSNNLVLSSNDQNNSKAYKIAEYSLIEDFVVGEEYTVTLKGQINAPNKFGMWRDEASTLFGYLVKDPKSDLWSFTGKMPDTKSANKDLLTIYNYPSTTAKDATIDWIVVTKGNKVVSEWLPSTVELNSRLRQVEQDITDGSIVQSISDVRDYAEGLQKALDDKADSSELSDYITEGSLEEKIKDAKDYTNQLIEGLNLSRYVEASEFKQLRDSFNFNLQNSGGINMIRNSLGYADFSYWDTPTGLVTTIDGSLKNAGFGSGFKSISKATRMKQTIVGTSVTGKYVLSFYLYNPNGVSAGIDLFSDNKKLSYVTKAGKSEEFQFISYPFESPTGNIRIEVCANGEGVVWTGLMLNAGEVPLTWQSHQEEVYNENIRFDKRGITVKNEISGGYTNISPKEFAGYAEIDGEVKRVFSVNGDITEVHKLYAEEELTMNPIKIVSITEGSNTGWAFVGM